MRDCVLFLADRDYGGPARRPWTPAGAADPPAEEAAPAPASDPAAALPAAATAPRRTARATAETAPEGVLGTAETARGNPAQGAAGGTPEKREARGERHRLHGGEAEASGIPQATGNRMHQADATGQFLVFNFLALSNQQKCEQIESAWASLGLGHIKANIDYRRLIKR